jgi:phospho-N-acetylmuramoyl-pentapeptide-transferase
LAGWFKILGQVILGVAVASTMLFNETVSVYREFSGTTLSETATVKKVMLDGTEKIMVKADEPITTIPFVKNHEFNYAKLIPKALRGLTWLLYILIVVFIVTAVSNGANITDGIDGLATGVSAIIGIALGVFAYASGNIRVAEYLNIMYIPNIGELSVFIAAMVGACIGFLWYNAYPAQIFMGDTGSLMLGGVIASLAFLVRKELLIPIFCAVFLIENLSVVLQVGYFKYTKKKFGEGRRIFLMSPLHHHYQKSGYHESKIVTRFWIVTLLFVILSVVTLKIR